MKNVNGRVRLAIWVFKYVPVLGTLIYTVHAGLFLAGLDGMLAECVAGMSILPTAVALLWSWAFGFCWLHKSMLVYIMTAGFIVSQDMDGFTPDLFLFVCGIALLAVLCVQKGRVAVKEVAKT